MILNSSRFSTKSTKDFIHKDVRDFKDTMNERFGPSKILITMV